MRRVDRVALMRDGGNFWNIKVLQALLDRESVAVFRRIIDKSYGQLQGLTFNGVS